MAKQETVLVRATFERNPDTPEYGEIIEARTPGRWRLHAAETIEPGPLAALLRQYAEGQDCYCHEDGGGYRGCDKCALLQSALMVEGRWFEEADDA